MIVVFNLRYSKRTTSSAIIYCNQKGGVSLSAGQSADWLFSCHKRRFANGR